MAGVQHVVSDAQYSPCPGAARQQAFAAAFGGAAKPFVAVFKAAAKLGLSFEGGRKPEDGPRQGPELAVRDATEQAAMLGVRAGMVLVAVAEAAFGAKPTDVSQMAHKDMMALVKPMARAGKGLKLTFACDSFHSMVIHHGELARLPRVFPLALPRHHTADRINTPHPGAEQEQTGRGSLLVRREGELFVGRAFLPAHQHRAAVLRPTLGHARAQTRSTGPCNPDNCASGCILKIRSTGILGTRRLGGRT